jgi:predicted regulator of Ras-like GTPase activity (Roadblock/LC7/MglB family)
MHAEVSPGVVSTTPAAQPTAAPTPSNLLSVALKHLAATWPEALRQEIVQLRLVDANLSLPCDTIEAALKRGRAAFPWRTVRSWIHPALPPSVSAHDAVELEFPLRVIAPLFLARQSAEGKAQRKVTIDEAIPNLFFGFPQPNAAPAAAGDAPSSGAGPVNKPVDTNYYVWSDVSETAQVDESEYKRKSPTGTDFLSRYATPNEIVSRAAALDGVAGALIALPDGLMVANRIPAELNGDTLAAFLPQIFSKVSQCTKELRMGDLNNLNFTVGNVPWKIFRVNAIFFAAFGRVAEPLPTAQLAELASELDRKK